jgi:arginyl-tRNA synthetase
MKLFLNNTINPVPYYFYACSRIGQILHTRIRTESSALNGHLYKKNIEANPYCSCKLVETSEHFLLKCTCKMVRTCTFIIHTFV